MLSAALDSGVAVSTIVIFFCLQFPQNGNIGLTTVQSWWGNTVSFNTADGLKTPLITLPDGMKFGYVHLRAVSTFELTNHTQPDGVELNYFPCISNDLACIVRLWDEVDERDEVYDYTMCFNESARPPYFSMATEVLKPQKHQYATKCCW